MTVELSVRGLVEFVLRCGSIDSRFSGFDRANEGSRIHRKLQKAAGANYRPEVKLKGVRVVDGIEYHLEGRADGIIEENGRYVVDEIKTTAAPAEKLTEDFNPLHWAQAKCYAAFWCADHDLHDITVQLTYYQIDTDEVIRHRRAFSALELENFLTETLRLYTPWARLSSERKIERDSSIAELRFPYPEYRAGQYRFAGAVYRTIAAKGRLFATAPTGIGKTISTLFPAVKALGEGHGERIFYLTAKTITRTAAEKAVADLRSSNSGRLRIKTVTLTAKDKICPQEVRICTPESCPRANGYFDRVNDALYRFLTQEDNFTRETILAFCEAENLCPFEFALDVSLFCDVIICDYNYLFDPVVNLKRFFAEEGGDYIFLIDEAHNLVDRARDMYSAELSKSAFLSAKKSVGKSNRRLYGALSKVNDAMLELRKQHESASKVIISEGLPDFAKLLSRFETAAQDFLEEHREGELHDEILQLYFDVRFYLRIYELYDEHFTTMLSPSKSELKVQLLCLDASPFVDASMALGRASILFSATLSPVDYFIRTLGCEDSAKRIFLESPFPQENLCLLCADGISTRYADRQRTLSEVCEMIVQTAGANPGNYLAFFPSYAYLRQAQEYLEEEYPGLPLLVQTTGMDEAARDAFLESFSESAEETLLGLCVLGGVFSEGVDLTGERLIGCIIVGVGLPQIGPELDALREYYDKTSDCGFEYAYQFPGMNKVLQAAGRVIRTENDRGVVLLIDDRFRRTDYRRLMPPHWSHIRSVRGIPQLQQELHDFWKKSEGAS